MRFADPAVCPSCASAISGPPSCGNCGFDLNSQPARELWQTLLKADELLAQARTASAQPPATTPAGQLPQAPALPAPRVRRSVSTGSILLGLGALFILVAGFIFITVSWGSLGVTGRALVLLAFTAVVGVLAAVVSRRGLRGSAEALWAVFLGLATVDWFAAWGEGLFGADSLPFVSVAVAWSLVLFAISTYVVRWARPRVEGVRLVSPMVVAGVAPWVGGAAIGIELFDKQDWTPFWSSATASVFVVAFLVSAVRLKLKLTAILLAFAAALGLTFVVVAAVVEAFDNSSIRELAVGRHGLPALIVVLAAVACGLADRRVASAGSAVAMLGGTLLVTLPIEDAHPGQGAFIALAAIIVFGALLLRGSDGWSRGARAATALLGAGLMVAALEWLSTLGSFVDQAWESGEGTRTLWASPIAIDEGAGPWWLALIVLGAIAGACFLSRWWPELKATRGGLLSATWLALSTAALVGLAAAEVPFAVVALALIVIGLALAEAPPKHVLGWSLVGPVVVALAPALAVSSHGAMLMVSLAASAALTMVLVRSQWVWRRELAAFSAAGWGLGAVGFATVLADQPDRYVALSLVLAAAGGLALASLPLRTTVGRRGIEVAALVIAGTGVGLASEGQVSLGWIAAIWTVVGASVSLISLFTPDRSYFRWVGFGSLGLAYVLRLVASDVETVEAYTLPFGLVLLAAGLWWMHSQSDVTTTRALGSGLLLALLPSLPLALDEPTSLRALLLGVAAFIALIVGVGRKWKAPFVLGAVILVALVIANLGPLAVALPRWTLIATVGSLLIGVGITWEARVRDGRAVASYLTSMR